MSTSDRNLEAERVRLHQAGANRVFTDVVSGKRFDRPGPAGLIEHARAGDRLCVTRLDRSGRSIREPLETVDTLKAHGIHLVSLEERLDTSSAAGELVFHVFGAIAHFERGLIPERTRDGIAAARKRGRTPRRPPPDPETVSAARKLIASGLSPPRAAKRLDIGRATAYPSVGKRVLVARDASREAARAVADALPLLKDAGHVVTLSANPESGTGHHGELPGADIARHLARHGVRVDVQRASTKDVSIADLLLNRIVDESIGLLVMGAYGHARVREIWLGGVTRRLMESMIVPVFLSH